VAAVIPLALAAEITLLVVLARGGSVAPQAPTSIAPVQSAVYPATTKDRAHSATKPETRTAQRIMAAVTLPSGNPSATRSGETPASPPAVSSDASTEIVRPLSANTAPQVANQSVSDTARFNPATPELRVTVGQSQRAAVIVTSNPKVTVVWLYPGDSL
jgi:hypothetical protein